MIRWLGRGGGGNGSVVLRIIMVEGRSGRILAKGGMLSGLVCLWIHCFPRTGNAAPLLGIGTLVSVHDDRIRGLVCIAIGLGATLLIRLQSTLVNQALRYGRRLEKFQVLYAF